MSLGLAQTLFSSQGLLNHPIGLASIHLALQVAPPSPSTQRTSGPPRGGITLGPSPDRSRSRPDFPLLRMPRPPGRLRSPQVSATTPRPRPAHSGRVPSALCSPGPPSDPTGPAPGPLVTAFPGRRSALPRRRPEAGRPADPQPRTHRAGLCVQPSGWPQPALALMPRLRRRHLPRSKDSPAQRSRFPETSGTAAAPAPPLFQYNLHATMDSQQPPESYLVEQKPLSQFQ